MIRKMMTRAMKTFPLQCWNWPEDQKDNQQSSTCTTSCYRIVFPSPLKGLFCELRLLYFSECYKHIIILMMLHLFTSFMHQNSFFRHSGKDHGFVDYFALENHLSRHWSSSEQQARPRYQDTQRFDGWRCSCHSPIVSVSEQVKNWPCWIHQACQSSHSSQCRKHKWFLVRPQSDGCRD